MALTKTAKKTREHKSKYIDAVRGAIDTTERVYLFSYENMRSNHFKDVRLHFRDRGGSSSSSGSSAGVGDGGGGDDDTMDNGKDDDDVDDVDDTNEEAGGIQRGGGGGRLFLGKNKLLQIAFGRTQEDEYSDNLSRLSPLLSGSVGVLCTNRDASHVEEYFATLSVEDYARAGTVASKTILITNAMIETHPVSMVEQFRKLGLPVEVQNGRVGMVGGREEYEVCKKDKELSVEQCKILVHMGVKLAVFKIELIRRWEKENGTVEEF